MESKGTMAMDGLAWVVGCSMLGVAGCGEIGGSTMGSGAGGLARLVG